MSADPNSFAALKSQLSADTLKDIEGLDPEKFGFGREECCGAVPKKLPGSMNMDKEHVFLVDPMHANAWGKRTENVPGCNELEKSLKEKVPKGQLTVAMLPPGQQDPYVLRFRMADSTMAVTQYSKTESGTVPWLTKGTLSTDRSEECFVFICGHRSRDERCGYCGVVLADLFRQSIAKNMSPEAAKNVTVMLCAHIGGHIYAGNVIVYNKHGGVGFGLFKPTDVDILVAAIAEGEGNIPDSLKDRIRGQITGESPPAKKGCSSM